MKQYGLLCIFNSIFNRISLGKTTRQIGYCYAKLLVVICMQNYWISHTISNLSIGLPLPACDPENIPEGSNWNIFHRVGNSNQPSVCVLELVMATLHASQFKSIAG